MSLLNFYFLVSLLTWVLSFQLGSVKCVTWVRTTAQVAVPLPGSWNVFLLLPLFRNRQQKSPDLFYAFLICSQRRKCIYKKALCTKPLAG